MVQYPVYGELPLLITAIHSEFDNILYYAASKCDKEITRRAKTYKQEERSRNECMNVFQDA